MHLKALKRGKLQWVLFISVFGSYAWIMNKVHSLMTYKSQESAHWKTNDSQKSLISKNVKYTSSGSLIIPTFEGKEAFIHVDEWDADDFCLSSLQDVYWHPLFPKYPNIHYLRPNLEEALIVDMKSAVKRYQFFLCPPGTDSYQFSITVKGGFDTFITEHSTKMTEQGTGFKKHIYLKEDFTTREKQVISEWMKMDKNHSYKFDLILWAKRGYKNHTIQVQWRNRTQLNFIPIKSSMFCSPTHSTNYISEMHLPLGMPITWERKSALRNPQYWFYMNEQRVLNDFITGLDSCKYEPSYLVHDEVDTYSGWRKVHESLMFPFYPILLSENSSQLKLAESKAKDIASQFFSVVKKPNCRNCKMDRIVYVEQNNETVKGHRYFVEIDVTDLETNQKLRISDYVYKETDKSKLCRPQGYIWRQRVDITVVFTTSSINIRWTLFLLDSIAKILYATGDRNVQVLIAAYGLKHVDLDFELRKRNLKGRSFHLPGSFNKVYAINAIIDRSVHDPESIVFTVDLHLEIPFHMFDQVRKNTILGKTIFAPIVVRMDCGKHLEFTDPGDSFWVLNGFGIIGAYKKDWDIIGGMNEEKYGTKWGGEDWELIDRVISRGYEVIRRRLSGFYHIYHSRKGAAWYH